MPGKLQNKIALITGGSRGIGEAIVRLFVKEGARVAFTYLSQSEKAKNLEKDLKGKAKGYLSNAASLDQTQECIKQITEELGKVEILVNNAGITRDNLLARMNEEDWDEVIKTNLKSCFNTIKCLTPTFMRERKGNIINLSSIIALKGNAGQANYAAAKAGIVGLTRSVAKELGPRHVRANVIAPGFIKTDMTAFIGEEKTEKWGQTLPLRRVGEPEDIARACLFFASEDSNYITGQVLYVDGGNMLI
ncbi:MAG: 3-oxoacyl-[acyl-carrier-protein] reductase [Cytophagales bacterium]|nr:3-oxoacyl-[acyl-carrier-protein] reductase [Cytophagales bacterium]